ncbi:MAG: gas vesicle protein K [Nitrososphaerales archaeon]
MQRAQIATIEKDQDKVANGLAKLVLTILETLKELMERQAERRIKEGALSKDQVERLGLTFMELNEKIGSIASLFNLKKSDLRLGLQTLDSQKVDTNNELLSIVDLLDRLIEKGVVVFGDLGLSVADVELINVQLRLIVNTVGRKKSKKKERKKTRHVGRKLAGK